MTEEQYSTKFHPLVPRFIRRRHEKHYRASKAHLAADLVLLLIVIGLVLLNIYLLIFYRGKQIAEKIDLKIIVAEEVISGESGRIMINYQNNSEYSLIDGHLHLMLPKSFILDEASREKLVADGKTFNLDKLWLPGVAGSLELTGLFLGAPGAAEAIAVMCDYGFTVEIGTTGANTVSARESYKIVDSLIKFNIAGNKFEVKDNEFKVAVSYENKSAIGLGATQIKTKWPKELVNSANFCQIDKLPAGVSGECLLSAYVPAKFSANSFSWELEVASNYQDQEVILLASQEEVKIIAPAVEVKYEIKNTASNIYLGDEINYKISYKNKQEEIKNCRLAVELLDDVYNLSAIKLNQGKIIGNQVLFDIGDLAADAVGEINFSVKSKMPGQSELIKIINDPEPMSLKSLARIDYDLSNETNSHLDYVASRLSVPINSRLKLKGSGQYYTLEGEQLGRGPNPPVAGETTSYRVLLELTNDIKPINNIAVKAHLPLEVSWKGNAVVNLGNDVMFDPQTREISWKIDQLWAGVGYATASALGSFEVEITPKLARNSYVLLDNIRLEGVDSLTNKAVIIDSIRTVVVDTN